MPPWTDPLGEGKELSAELQVFEGQYWREVAQHWNISDDQRGPVLCPKKTPGLDGDCPICEFVAELKKDKKNAKAKQLAKDARAKTTFLLNIVDESDPVYTAEDVAEWKKNRPDNDVPFEVGETKIQIYAAPLTVHDTILGIITDTGQDITELEGGQAVIITRFPNKDPKKTRYQVMPSMKPVGFEPSHVENIPALHQSGFTMTYQEMLDLLQSGVGGDFVAALPEGDDDTAGALPSGDDDDTSVDDVPRDAADLEAQMRANL